MLDAQRGRQVFKRKMALNQLKRTLVNDVDAMGVKCRARNAEELSLLLQGMPDLVDKLMPRHWS